MRGIFKYPGGPSQFSEILSFKFDKCKYFKVRGGGVAPPPYLDPRMHYQDSINNILTRLTRKIERAGAHKFFKNISCKKLLQLFSTFIF